jgi:O-antigen/teichoic acid export membrane protein
MPRNPLARLAQRPRMKAGLIVVAGNMVGAAAAFAAAIVAVRTLSLDQFAAFGVGLAVNSLAVQFADFGLGMIAIAETADSADPRAARAKLKALARHRARTAILVGILVAVVVLVLPSLAPYRAAAMIGASGEIFGCLSVFFILSLQGEHSFIAAGSLQSLQGILRLTLVGACAIAGTGAAPMMVGYAILAPGVTALVGGFLLFGRPPGEREAGRPRAPGASNEVDIDRRRVIAVAGVFAAMVINGDVLLLTMLAGSHEVAVYTAAWRFSSGLLLINTAVASALLPFIVSASDPWWEAKLLLRRGLIVAGGWLLALPLLAFAGPILLGSIGSEAREPLIILLVAFAIDGFYFVVYQIYLRVRRERLILISAVLEFATMAGVTVLLRSHGALAPAWGQLSARFVILVVILVPIGLAAIGRCSWFDEEEAAAPAPAPETPYVAP